MNNNNFYEEVSEALGLGGKITYSVEIKAKRLIEDLLNGKLKCKDHEGEIVKPESFGGFFWGDLLCKNALKEREQFLSNVLSDEI